MPRNTVLAWLCFCALFVTICSGQAPTLCTTIPRGATTALTVPPSLSVGVPIGSTPSATSTLVQITAQIPHYRSPAQNAVSHLVGFHIGIPSSGSCSLFPTSSFITVPAAVNTAGTTTIEGEYSFSTSLIDPTDVCNTLTITRVAELRDLVSAGCLRYLPPITADGKINYVAEVVLTTRTRSRFTAQVPGPTGNTAVPMPIVTDLEYRIMARVQLEATFTQALSASVTFSPVSPVLPQHSAAIKSVFWGALVSNGREITVTVSTAVNYPFALVAGSSPFGPDDVSIVVTGSCNSPNYGSTEDWCYQDITLSKVVSNCDVAQTISFAVPKDSLKYVCAVATSTCTSGSTAISFEDATVLTVSLIPGTTCAVQNVDNAVPVTASLSFVKGFRASASQWSNSAMTLYTKGDSSDGSKLYLEIDITHTRDLVDISDVTFASGSVTVEAEAPQSMTAADLTKVTPDNNAVAGCNIVSSDGKSFKGCLGIVIPTITNEPGNTKMSLSVSLEMEVSFIDAQSAKRHVAASNVKRIVTGAIVIDKTATNQQNFTVANSFLYIIPVVALVVLGAVALFRI